MLTVLFLVFFFFFKQKTAYEMYLVTGVQTCALPICFQPVAEFGLNSQKTQAVVACHGVGAVDDRQIDRVDRKSVV